jgi:hypothetical protein
MAKFCSDECTSICDFCIHYQDEYRDIKQLKREDGSSRFAGEGKCGIDNSDVDTSDGMNCDNFECFKIGKEEN